MLSDYILPGSIVLLKFCLRIATDEETNTADTAKALMLFPIDIAFLSLSYGSAILYSSNHPTVDVHAIKAIIAAVVLAISLLVPVIIISKKAARAFVLDRYRRASGLAFFGYLFSIAITMISINIGGIL